MKKLLLSHFLLLISLLGLPKDLFAQNVGIGTHTPGSTLDVKGNLRTGGASKYISFDTTSGRIIWNNANLFLPASQYLVRHSDSAEGLRFDGGQMQYLNSTGHPVFSSSWADGKVYISGKLGVGTANPYHQLHVEGNSYLSGNIGIDNVAPVAPLTFSQSEGEKINFKYLNDLSRTGIGTGAAELQFYVPDNTHSFVFATGTSGTYSELVRFNGNGSILFNGSTGTEGQVLRSTGPSTPPLWSTVSSPYNSISKAEATNWVFLQNSNPSALLPGLIKTITLNDSSKVKIDFSMPAVTNHSGAGVRLTIMLDNIPTAQFHFVSNSTSGVTLAGTELYSLGAGTYTFTIMAEILCAGCFTYVSDNRPYFSRMIVQLFPQ